MHLAYFSLALLVTFIWGFSFVAIPLGLAGIPPLSLVCLRFLLLSFPAIFFIKRPKTSFLLVALYGFTMFGLQFGLLFVGMYLGITPGIAALITQIQLFFTLALGVIFLKERPSLGQFIGCIISFIGLGIIAMHLQGTVSLEGFLLVLASGLCSSLGNLVSKKMNKVNTFSLVIWGSLIAWPFILPIALYFEGPNTLVYALHTLKPMSILAILYITYGSTLVGYGLWNYLVHHLPLSTISPFLILVPIIAMIGSVLCLKESFEPWKILATLFVVSGLSLNFFTKKLFIHKEIIKD